MRFALPHALVRRIRLAATFARLVGLGGAALGATMPVAWTPVADTAVTGYRVYAGTSSGSYTQSFDVGPATSFSLTGLADCTPYYVAVKAYNSSGAQSDSYSNEISGLSSIVLTAVDPPSVLPGQTVTLTLTGANFAPGASVLSADPRMIVVSSTYASCASLQATVTIAAGAASGPVSFDVLNLDGTTARAPSLLSIAVPPPDLTVAATLPAAGATGAATNVHPAVAFNAPVSPASVTGATVLLLGPDGAPVPQASGSPILDAAGTTVTIVPAAPLLSSTTYRLQAAGGAGGVVDLSARAMSSTFTQDPGFTTAEPTTPPPPDVTSSTPADGAKMGSLTVQPTVTFSKAMDAASITSDTVRLLDFAGLPVLQAPGSPALDPSGTVATITLAAPLADKSWFRLQVIGGATGVRSADGAPMAQTFQQSSGFQTVNVAPGNVTNLRPQGHH